MSARWEPAFVAVSILVGEPLEGTLAILGDGAGDEVAELARGLRAPTRDARAQALARVLSEVALAVDAARSA